MIASQALISGAFSLTNQAMQLGFLPPVTVVHTSGEEEGQVYVPEVNLLLAVACVALVLIFRHSSRLASAYGIAVTGTMVLTSHHLLRGRAHHLAVAALEGDLVADSVSLGRPHVLRFEPLQGGRRRLSAAGGGAGALRRDGDLEERPAHLSRSDRGRFAAVRRLPGRPAARSPVARTPGAGVFVTGHPDGVPPVLRALVERVRVLPETVVLLTMQVCHVPRITPGEGAATIGSPRASTGW